jgi:hypothetical protein
LWFLSCFFNTWLTIVLSCIIIFTLLRFSARLRKFCLIKRGKYKNV